MDKKRGPKKKDNDARDRLVHAVVFWLMHDYELSWKLSPQPEWSAESNPELAALREPVGYSDGDPSLLNWMGSDRYRKAADAINWRDIQLHTSRQSVTLKTSQLTSPAIKEMGGAPGIARMLLQRYVPTDWCTSAGTLLGAKLSIKPSLDFTVVRVWNLFDEQMKVEPFATLSAAAGFPATPILLQPSTIAQIYKRQQSNRT